MDDLECPSAARPETPRERSMAAFVPPFREHGTNTLLTARRCSATNRAGQPCGRSPHPGAVVCLMHGAAAPQVRESARLRLLAGADLAIDYLLNLLVPLPPCPTCGRSDADRDPVVVRACQLVLDRAGFGPNASITVVAPPEPMSDLSAAELASRAEKLAVRARELADAEPACPP